MDFNLFITIASKFRPISDLAMKKMIHLNLIDRNKTRLMSIVISWLDLAESKTKLTWSGWGKIASSHSNINNDIASSDWRDWYASGTAVPWPWPSKCVYRNGITKSIPICKTRWWSQSIFFGDFKKTLSLKNYWILLRILSLNCDWLYIYIDTESAESILLFFFFKA